MNQTTVQRSYKDSLFRMVFREKKELLSLYNALNGTDYVNPEALTITTIEDVLYMGLKNDISFLIEDVMNLYEGQSSWNPNMPLRGLFYISQVYQGYVKEQHLDIYSSALLRLPTPKYVVFYNGTRQEPERQELLLSASFINPEERPCIECTALVLNINYGHNQELMKACKKLHDYSYFVEQVRGNLREGLMLEEAVDRAVLHCIQADVLREFLEKHRAEVKHVILTEYDEELHAKTLYEEGLSIGVQAFRQSLLQYIGRKWPITEELKEKIEAENSLETLQHWMTLAWDCNSIEELSRQILPPDTLPS